MGWTTEKQAQIERIIEKLKASDKVLIGTHEHPDGDAVGSTLAVKHVLERMGKQVVGYLPDPAPEFLEFLPGVSDLTCEKPDPSEFDLVVLLDYTQMIRTHLKDELKGHENVICIDHHRDNLGEATINLIVGEAAATAQILYEIFQQGKFEIKSETATCLLTGIFTDTGSFMHDSTTPELMKLASELMSRGARLSHIAHETYQKKDLPALRVWGRALSRVMVSEETGAAVSIITYKDLDECGAGLDDLAGVVNMLNTLPNTKFAMLLAEYEPGKIKGSLRSEPHKNMDVSQVAKNLGGGGHKLASGFEISGRLIQKDNEWRVLPVSINT